VTYSNQDHGGDLAEGLLFGVDDLHAVRALVRRRARLAGLSDEGTDDLVLAVHEVAACAFAVDTRPALLVIGGRADRVVCEIREAAEDSASEKPDAAPDTVRARSGSRLTDPAVGPGRGWRIAHALCDEVQGAADGTGVRMSMLLLPAVAGPPSGAVRDRSDTGD
jgi:hypothetical protein